MGYILPVELVLRVTGHATVEEVVLKHYCLPDREPLSFHRGDAEGSHGREGAAAGGRR